MSPKAKGVSAHSLLLVLLLPSVQHACYAARIIAPESKLSNRISSQERNAYDLLSPLSSVRLNATHQRLSTSVPNYENPWISTVFSNRSSNVLPKLKQAQSYNSTNLNFDLKTAVRVARLQSVSYCVTNEEIMSWNCTRCSSVSGVQPHVIIYDDVWDVMAYLAYDSVLGAITVVFRGTDSSNLWNWFEDLRYWRTNYMVDEPDAAGAKIHTGFWLLWNSSDLEQNVTDAFVAIRKQYPNVPVYIIGHSMGGALAQLCVVHFKEQLQETDMHLFTFGSPRVGNTVFASLVENTVLESWRFTHNRDLVPSVPFQVLGFHHAAEEVWLVDIEDSQTQTSDEKIILCDDSGEDPGCHNSVCHLGLCTSVADHLIYLGIHLYRDEFEC